MNSIVQVDVIWFTEVWPEFEGIWFIPISREKHTVTWHEQGLFSCGEKINQVALFRLLPLLLHTPRSIFTLSRKYSFTRLLSSGRWLQELYGRRSTWVKLWKAFLVSFHCSNNWIHILLIHSQPSTNLKWSLLLKSFVTSNITSILLSSLHPGLPMKAQKLHEKLITSGTEDEPKRRADKLRLDMAELLIHWQLVF